MSRAFSTIEILCGVLVSFLLVACGASDETLPQIPPVQTDGFLPVVAEQLQGLRAEVERHPNSAAAAGQLGMAYMVYGLPGAAEALERAHRLQPDHWQWLYLHALALSNRGQFAEAVTLLDRLSEQKPGQLTIGTRLGQAYALLGRLDKADEVLSDVLRHDPDRAEAMVALAQVRLKTGRAREAIVQMERLLSSYGPSGNAYYILGEAWREVGDKERSERNYLLFERFRDVGLPSEDTALQQANSLDLSDRPLVSEARRRLALGETDAAIRLMLTALERNPDNTAIRESLMVLYAERGQFDKANAHYERALESGPPKASLLRSLGQLRIDEGRLAEARDALQQSLELDPHDALICTLLGIVSRRENQATEAIDWFSKSIKLDPHDPAARMNLAELLLIQQRFDEAIGHLALLLSPESDTSLRALMYMGQALLRLGRVDEGRARLEQAIAVGSRLGNQQAVAQAKAILARGE